MLFITYDIVHTKLKTKIIIQNMKIYLHLKIKEKSMIRNKTLLFSLGCFGLFSIFSSNAMGKSALPQITWMIMISNY